MSERSRWQGPLEEPGQPARLRRGDEPPETSEGRETEWVADHDARTRDMRPALGARGGPASWVPADVSAGVALGQPGFGDARWSFLYKSQSSSYAAAQAAADELTDANRRMRSAPVAELHGPFVKPPVWTWQIPTYFWVGGIASGAGFVALACDLAGDHRSARVARGLALAAVLPAPVLLIEDLGRPERFLNMLRVFKPRSPMNMGAWCLLSFGATVAAAVGADVIGKPRAARALGALTAVLGGYLGSYTGALLACTAVPLWARSRLLLGPIFVSTATATGAAATRLVLATRGLPASHPTRAALGALETGSIIAELALSAINERRVGPAAGALRRGRAGGFYRVAQSAMLLGLAAQLLARRRSPRTQDAGSVLYLAGGLAFRHAWAQAGRVSASDHEAAAAMGRGRRALAERPHRGRGPSRLASQRRKPLTAAGAPRAWGEAVRRASLAVERLVRG